MGILTRWKPVRSVRRVKANTSSCENEHFQIQLQPEQLAQTFISLNNRAEQLNYIKMSYSADSFRCTPPAIASIFRSNLKPILQGETLPAIMSG